MKIWVAVALPARQEVLEIEMEAGACAADVLRHVEVARMVAAHGLGHGDLGVWGRRCGPRTPLREGDRVEFYRPLEADAKAQRRARVAAKRRGDG